MKAGSAHEYVLDAVLPWIPSAHWKWKYLACTWIRRIFVCLFCWIFVFNFFALGKKMILCVESFMSLKTLQWLKLINKVLACCWSCSISCLRNALENSFHIIFSLQYHKSPQSHLQSWLSGKQHAQSLQIAGKDIRAFSANKQDLFPQELLVCFIVCIVQYFFLQIIQNTLTVWHFFASLPSVRLSSLLLLRYRCYRY